MPTTTALDWADAQCATSYEVYFGVSNPPEFVGAAPTSAWSLPTLENGTTYYWQIVPVNSNGSTPGPLWSFTTAPPSQPLICRDPNTLVNSCGEGQNAPDQTFEVWNCGSGTLNYAITDDADWLWCDPYDGMSTGEHDTITVHYETAWLPCGQYLATIAISDPGASNDPLTMVVTLTVTGTQVQNITTGATYCTIQAAIDAANSGNEIVLALGTFVGAGNRGLDFHGKPITVRSTNPEDPAVVAATIIDSQQLGRGFNFHSGEGSDCVVAGLTITGGLAAHGGGIYCQNSSPTIRNCAIAGNSAADGASGTEQSPDGGPGGCGGGFYCEGADLTLANCSITTNRAGNGGQAYVSWAPGTFGDGGLGGSGGGVYCISGTLTLIDCLVAGNTAGNGGGSAGYPGHTVYGNGGDGGHGGGVYCAGGSVIARCTIDGNAAGNGCNGDTRGGSGGSGGGIDVGGGLTMAECAVTANSAGAGGSNEDSCGGKYGGNGGSGGGVQCTGDAQITNCLIEGNRAGKAGNGFVFCSDGGDGGNGGGLYCGGILTIGGCTVNGNEAGDGGDGRTGGLGGNGGAVSCASGLTCERSVMIGNVAGAGGGGHYGGLGGIGGSGGGLYVAAGVTAENNCVVAGNVAGDGGHGSEEGGAGGGLACNGEASITNCTVVANTGGAGGEAPYGQPGEDGAGGGVLASAGAIVGNCVLWGNVATLGPQVSGPATVSYSCVQGGYSGEGNIYTDPLFVDSNADFRLSPGSSCIDAGNNELVPVDVTTDLDGNSRFVDDRAVPDTGHGTPPIVDIGAFEFQGNVHLEPIP